MKKTNSSFSLSDGRWALSWPGRVSQHDVVCLSPPLDPIQGMPLGNGDLGALVWCEPRKLCIAINKCDLWEDSPDEADGYLNDPHGHHTEEYTTLRHGCRLEIDLGLPFMDLWYLKDFEARLDIARGMAVIRSETPFGALRAKVYVSAAAKIVSVECDLEGNEAFAPRITMERWGSRISYMPFGIYDRNPSWGLAGTATETDGNRLLIRKQLTKLDFTVAADVDNQGAPLAPAVAHSRAGFFEPARAARHSLRIAVAIANSEESGDSRRAAGATLDAARRAGLARIEAEHIEFWRAFWDRSWVRTHHDAVDNIWHLCLYYASSSQRGRYPGLFTQALWAWNRDYQVWNHYFHWNQQQLCWPVCGSGHPELLKAFLDYRFSQLPGAIAAARQHNLPGAFYSDWADRSGHMTWQYNRTPGGQSVAEFWRKFRYDGDEAYLREKGWPVIVEVARWHMGMLEKKDDGLYHTTPGWGYEGGNMLRDCPTELITTRRVLEVALDCAGRFGHDPAEVALWREALENLAPLVTMESPVNPGVTIFSAGYQKGFMKRPAPGEPADPLPVGDAEEWAHPVKTAAHDPKKLGHIFSDVETSPIFPDGRIGLKDKGTPLFDIALNTAREANLHWTGKLVLIRMGLGKEIWKDFGPMPNFMGFGLIKDPELGYWRLYHPADPALNPVDFLTKDFNTHPDWEPFKNSKIPLRAFDFRRLGMEQIYGNATALTEALLQSHEGAIRIACAMPDDAPFAFTLMAHGGFYVSAEGVGATPSWIHIESLRGERCAVVNPWPGRIYLLDVAANTVRELEGSAVEFDTKAGGRYLLSPERITAADWTCTPIEVAPNRGPKKTVDEYSLGIPRMYGSEETSKSTPWLKHEWTGW